jgi:hypothetical protein
MLPDSTFPAFDVVLAAGVVGRPPVVVAAVLFVGVLPEIDDKPPDEGGVYADLGSETASYLACTLLTSVPVARAISAGVRLNWFIVDAIVASSAVGLAKNQSNICWSEIAILCVVLVGYSYRELPII